MTANPDANTRAPADANAPADAKRLLTRFIDVVWNEGDAVDRYVADAYTVHHDPGDPWDGKTLDGRFTGHWQVVDRRGVFMQLRAHAASAA